MEITFSHMHSKYYHDLLSLNQYDGDHGSLTEPYPLSTPSLSRVPLMKFQAPSESQSPSFLETSHQTHLLDHLLNPLLELNYPTHQSLSSTCFLYPKKSTELDGNHIFSYAFKILSFSHY
jgi:hypothetical protein